MPTPDSHTALVGPDLAPGAIRLTGRDVLTVLHNISTQSLLDLVPGHARLMLLCDFRGRLLHRAYAALVSDGSVWLVREDGGGASLAGAIDRAVFREDVKIEDLSASVHVSAGWTTGADTANRASEQDGRPLSIAISGCPTLTLDFAASAAGAAGAAGAASAAGAGAPDSAAWNTGRIEHGWAAHDREISEAFTPFDVNLGNGVHLDKGCFTGQETLMRLVTYGNLRRRLVRVGGDGAFPADRALRDGAGAEAGALSSAITPGSGWAALAVVKQVMAPEGGELSLADGRRARIERVFPFQQPAGRALRES